MSKLTNQILLKVSPELDALIDNAFSNHLKQTGEYITRSDYIRRILNLQCSLDLSESNIQIIYAWMNTLAKKSKDDGNKDGYDVLFDIANKFKDLWETLKEQKKLGK